MLMEAFNAGNVTDEQVEDVSGLLEKHIHRCEKLENKGAYQSNGYGR